MLMLALFLLFSPQEDSISHYPEAFKTLLIQEGLEMVDDPNDCGGLSKYGITLKDIQYNNVDMNDDDRVNKLDIYDMILYQAEVYYREYYWRVENLNSKAIAIKTFSNCVNFGLGTGIKLLQRAAIQLGCKIEDDGKLGPETAEAINKLNEKLLMTKLIELQAERYWEITQYNIAKRATKPVSKGGLGWPTGLAIQALGACQSRNLDLALKILSKVKKIRSSHLEGNLRFLRGWLRRAYEKYGLE